MTKLNPRRCRGGLSAGLLTLAALLLLVAAGPAFAAPQWRITSVHAPQTMAPSGTDRDGQYLIQPYNIGTNNSSGPITVTVSLPAGVTAQSASVPDGVNIGPKSTWSCSGDGPGIPGASEVTCTSSVVIGAPGNFFFGVPGMLSDGTVPDKRGVGVPISVVVSVSPSASGVLDSRVTISGGGAANEATDIDPTPIGATPSGFGFVPNSFTADAFDAGFPAGSPLRQAGAHPYEMRVDFDANLALKADPDTADLYMMPEGDARTIETRLPRGMLGNPQATPKCKPSDLVAGTYSDCPPNSQVGLIDIVVSDGKYYGAFGNGPVLDLPVYNMEPPPGTVAAFAFQVFRQPVYIIASIDPADNYSVKTALSYVNQIYAVRGAELTLWGVPADPAHDRMRYGGFVRSSSLLAPSGSFVTSSSASIQPFLSMPSQCEGSGSIALRADSWQNPGAFTPWQPGAEARMTGCEDARFRFKPTISIQPTSREAASPTGLDIDLNVPQKDDSFESSDPATNAANAAKLYADSGNDAVIATPPLKDAVTHLPPGMAVNPSAADGLTGCSEREVGLDNNDDPACPDSAKIGTVEIESDLVSDTLKGFIYQAKQSANPFGSILGFYTVAQGDGLTIKLAARVDADPNTGDLTTTFLDNPQLGFTHYRLHFWGGERAPLVNPPTCGSYAARATFTSWNSNLPAVETGDTTQITSGPNGGPCPNGLAGRAFNPAFRAGSADPTAGAFSSFALDVSRADGAQELRGIEATLPQGMVGKLAGIPYCPEGTIASISTAPGSGLAQRLAPSCPAASLVGHSDAAAGAGARPFHNPGSVYLAGPYKGAPLSLAIVTPVVAGPLDLGSIVVRAALYVDPATAQIRAVSDPIPDKIVADGNGFPLNVRSVRIAMDRPGFTLNPTSCEAMSVGGTLTSLQGAVANASEPFQVGACAALGFKPRLDLRLKGATGRGGHPALRATLRMPGGNANIARSEVTLPRSEFLDQGHIKTICTRVQYAAAGKCPAGSVYGYATAWSPLLDQPLRGPVYLRSSDHELPDLVASLDGQIHIDLGGRIDSVRKGIRTTFELVPDAPVSKFVLSMQGGKKGLLENSRDLCARAYRAAASFDAHNGRSADLRPALRANCAKGKGGRPTKG